METEDFIKLTASGSSDSGSGKDPTYMVEHELGEDEHKGNELNGEQVGHYELDTEIEEGQLIPESNNEEDAGCNSSLLHEGVDFSETPSLDEKLNHVMDPATNGCTSVQDETAISNHKTDDSSKSCVKRSRTTFEEQQPSVQIKYNSLPRDSKRKLEELLQHWSEWHARYCSSSHLGQDPNGEFESGEKTYFPAISVGVDKTSAVSFWVDDRTKEINFSLVDDDSVPLYDRGYAFGLLSVDGLNNLDGGLEIMDASRCFNCGSYNHSLKECPKPRDNIAVNSARKQHKSRRNQTPGSRNPTRYYQSSPGGRFEGLRAGVLDGETRKLLGLGELDPPPWLNRMREIGYPPGYLDPEDEDQPSGIVIYADNDRKEEQEEGEILESDLPKPKRRKSVKYPGINAPIPEHADKRLWAAGASGSDSYRNRDYGASESYSRWRYRELRNNWESKDDGPPGCSGYESNYISHSSKPINLIPRSPSTGRSLLDRGRSSASVLEDSQSHGSYTSSSRRSPSRRSSQQNSDFDDRRDDYPSRSKDKDDRARHYSGW
ncbi:hypothetical protein Ancab_029078 [Ancistrocladus abbreviatus]